jgi:hypothetical protein
MVGGNIKCIHYEKRSNCYLSVLLNEHSNAAILMNEF